MKIIKMLFGLLLTVAILTIIYEINDYYAEPPEKIMGFPYVIDGDTLSFSGKIVRLKGIDALETDQICTSFTKEIPCGRIARAHMVQIINKKALICEVDGKDKYNRLLGVCKDNDFDIGAELVRRGYAVAYGNYEQEEAVARKEKKGIWAYYFESPSEWRKKRAPSYLPSFFSKKKIPLIRQEPEGLNKELKK